MTNPYDYLLAKHQECREANPPSLNLRTYRAISWLRRSAELQEVDVDTSFVLAWISFNSAYARELPAEQFSHARLEFKDFFEKLIQGDPRGRILDQLWYDFEGPILALLESKFLFSPFWSHLNGRSGYENWEESFIKSKAAAQRAVENQDEATLLSIVFDRLYVLRNQILHGGATWKSKVNRTNVETGNQILHSLLPVFVITMIKSPTTEWGDTYYPVIAEDDATGNK